MPIAVRETEKDRAFRRVGSKDLIVDRLQEQNTKSIKHSDSRQQQHARQPFQRVRQPIAYKTQKILHAGWPA